MSQHRMISGDVGRKSCDDATVRRRDIRKCIVWRNKTQRLEKELRVSSLGFRILRFGFLSSVAEFLLFFFVTLKPRLNDTQVYEPSIHALLKFVDTGFGSEVPRGEKML